MFRSDNPITPTPKTINCVLMNGGVGDHIGGSLIAINYIARTYPWITILAWVPDFLLDFAQNVLPSSVIVRNYSSMPKLYNKDITTITTAWDGRVSPMKVHQTDYAFQVLCDEQVTVDKKNYLKVNIPRVAIKKFEMPKNYVVLVTGFTAKVREFEPKTVNAIADYVISKGYTPVFLGQKQTATGGKFVIEGNFSEEIDYNKGINLIDKTSLLEAAKIMGSAAAVVGVDSGLLHVAACTDVPIVTGYTTVTPGLRAPVRHNVLGWNWFPVAPDESLGCRFCQVKTNFLYGHDYKECLYKDYECVKQLTASKFIAKLKALL